MTDSIRYGIESLHHAIQKYGDNGAVTVEQWREVFYTGHASDSPLTKRQAFHRCRIDMVKGNVVGAENDIYRLTTGKDAAWLDAHAFINSLSLAADFSRTNGSERDSDMSVTRP